MNIDSKLYLGHLKFIYCFILYSNMVIAADVNDYLARLADTVEKIDKDSIRKVIDVLLETREKGGRIFIFGNGGSAATASHYVCDFNKGVSIDLDKKFDFVCLSDNTATMMAIANDIGYDYVFSKQLEGRLRKGDVIIAISGSGNSKNVIKAVEYAKKNGNKIISLTGYNGGRLLQLADYSIHADINDMQIAEDVHMIMCHLMASTIAKELGHPMC